MKLYFPLSSSCWLQLADVDFCSWNSLTARLEKPLFYFARLYPESCLKLGKERDCWKSNCLFWVCCPWLVLFILHNLTVELCQKSIWKGRQRKVYLKTRISVVDRGRCATTLNHAATNWGKLKVMNKFNCRYKHYPSEQLVPEVFFVRVENLIQFLKVSTAPVI